MGNIKRRWFRFSLRTLFVLLTVFGVWFGMQMKWMRDRRDALRWVAKHNGYGHLIVSHTEDSEGGFSTTIVTNHYGQPAPAPWQIRLLGEPPGIPWLIVMVSSSEERRRAEQLKRLFPERKVTLCDQEGNDLTAK